jgi:DNA-binding Lrp family transcriptional regulator
MFHLLYLMKTKDLLIVSQLRGNARVPVLGISKAVNLCRATVAERVRVLQKQVIQKYTALIDFVALGYGTRLGLTVRLAERDKLVFVRYLEQHACLNNLYKTTDGADFFVEMIFASIEDADAFVQDLSRGFALKSLHAFFIERDLVREAFLQNARSVLEVHDDSSL